ncbi:hypothetical protein SEA_NIGHTMARE_41 [Arthrobacter phage Nightmare]|uniref:Uncharacterized protein n=1 Tax=Arthrobacter phage Nightmare TaxID=2015864 RepID=A0A221J6I4_9CAUD|nr:hypothetical protein QCN33_gp41 [Arthrobacter phage Nightmare]ASM62317.1 hypothetical protein SEA_NIGHTMARE_41 [Arthrobacter phage Nightmare]
MLHITSIAEGARKFVVDNSPMILTGMAVAGLVTTAVLAAKASPRAWMDVQHAESERTEPLTTVEKVKLTYHYFIPAAVAGSLTIGAIIMAQSINARRQAAFISAYTLVDNRFKDYQQKVVEKMGQAKEQEVRDDIAQDYVNANPMNQNTTLIVNDNDTQAFLDTLSGRHFLSSVEKVRKAENKLNYQLNNDAYASLNDFYEALGIPHISMGEELGWRSGRMVDVRLSTALDNDRAVITIDFSVEPIGDYYRGF